MSDGIRLSLSQQDEIPLNATISCEPGKVTALIGPSGSGKSTLLRSVAGLYQPQAGTIVCAGETWFDSQNQINLPTQARRIGMVFQHFALFPHLSARANIIEALQDQSRARRRAIAESWLERVHLHGLGDRLPHQLSGGQQQRVAVARALAREPKVLLLDEPFSAVDRRTREALYLELAELRGELRMPVLLVTHDVQEATLLADQMCIISAGNCLQTGTPNQLLQAPASAQVAQLLGARNLFPARIISHTADHSLLRWQNISIKTKRCPELAVGEPVDWFIPETGILLMPLNERPGTELDNPVDVMVQSILLLGDECRVTLKAGDTELAMRVPQHVAQRYALAVGQHIKVRLRGETIHFMPRQPAS